MSQLREDDRRAEQQLIDTMVLDQPHAHALNLDAQKVILVTCGVCRHIGPIFRNRPTADLTHPPPHVIPIELEGGALIIPTDSPLSQAKQKGNAAIESIRQASRLNSITTVALQAHVPCQATARSSLTLLKTIDLLVNAKTRIKWNLNGMKVACFLSLPGNTYFVSATKWERWKTANRFMTWI